ncbi:MAG TPA: isoprenylcysteine carboxylmethyltransferase family protein [Candidatus Sulfotelmatobacter sp.]|jgi:protein-S-isoprenylcysteine O-methyltransferase Ste14|nr:isoprenylcysteine carboxylmethyltransferase family protein [Candidatus Sulfotelmatobacter sp.]
MEGRALYIFTVIQIVAIAAALWLVFSMPGPWDFQRCIGAALMILGIAGIVTARYQLGKSFAIRAKAHELVTRGIYSKIRNPIYVSGAVLLAGFVLLLHRPMLWLVFLALIIMQTFRARREAKVLEAAFGDAYREYRRKTWF